MTGRCPTSGKTGYKKKAHALAAARVIRSMGSGPSMRAYRCECGRWHLTSYIR